MIRPVGHPVKAFPGRYGLHPLTTFNSGRFSAGRVISSRSDRI